MTAFRPGPLLAFTLLLAGCLGPAGPEAAPPPLSPSFGLGLNTTNLPLPIPFAENPAELERLERFIREAAKRETGCGEGYLAEVEADVARGHHLGALDELAYDCASIPGNIRARELAEEAIAMGAEEYHFQRLRAVARQSLDASAKAVASLRPDTMLEAELAVHFLWTHLFNENLDLADETFAVYKEEPRRIQLVNAYLQVLAPAMSANLTVRLIERYDWNAATGCPPASNSAFLADAERMYAEAVALATAQGDPDDAQWVNTMLGHLVKVDGPRLDEVRRMNSMVGILRMQVQLSWDLAYWQNYTAQRLPTRDEALHLIAAYRNHTRTLVTEDQLFLFGDPIPQSDEREWEERRVTSAIRALALPGLRTSFDAYACP